MRFDCDVLIAGGGPTGVTLAVLLARRGVKVIVAEKEADIYPLPRAAVNEVVRFAIGEGRFPTLEVEDVEPEEALREDLAVSEEDAASLTAFIASLVRCSHLKSSARQMMRRGLACKTAPVILAIRRGQFVLDLPRPQDCFPTFRDGDPTADVERMVWCYPFPKEV